MRRWQRISPSLGMLLAVWTSQAAIAGDLIMPVACDIGRTCVIQNYVDIDNGPSARDYMCGTLTYDKHNGVDFRVISQGADRTPVHVIAAADGKVLRLRDGLADLPVKGNSREAIAGNECGNGVVVGHSGDRETQYCHLAKGSIAVKPGDVVRAGDMLGAVGMSGLTEYPHLHFIVRKGGKVIDPFGSNATPGNCTAPPESEWTDDVRKRLAYTPRVVINAGFSTGAMTNEMIEAGVDAQRQPRTTAEALVAYIRAIGLKTGDEQSLVLRDPNQRIIAENRPKALLRNQAQTALFIGKKRSAASWPGGKYSATYIVKNNNELVLNRVFDIELR
jgi:hypothetical protein